MAKINTTLMLTSYILVWGVGAAHTVIYLYRLIAG